MKEMRNIYSFMLCKLEGKRPLRRPGMILKWILEKYCVRVWSGFSWFRIGTSGGIL
jgi:hypothetical protein